MPSPDGRPAAWRATMAATAACTLPGLLVRLGGGAAPYPVQLVAYGAAVVAGAFMLAWACEAAQVDIAHGLVVAIVAFVAILPEFIVEIHFAITAQVEYVAANLTGASRLLLGFAVALPAALGLVAPGRHVGSLALAAPHRVELAILGLAAAWSLRAVATGRLTVLDSGVLISLYALYLRRVAVAGDDAPAPTGVAAQLAELPRDERRRWVGAILVYSAVIILLTAVPFGDAVLGSGRLVGISPFLLLQWIVPVATETPELVVASVLLMHGRGGQSIAVLLAGAVSQYTLALGVLPLAYHAGAGTGPLPLAGRERVELLLTVGVALYAVAALVDLRLSRGDSSIMLALFAGQLVLPGVLTRFLFAVLFWAVALDVLAAERHRLPTLAAALRSPRRGAGGAPPPGSVRRRPDRSHTRSSAAAAARRSSRR